MFNTKMITAKTTATTTAVTSMSRHHTPPLSPGSVLRRSHYGRKQPPPPPPPSSSPPTPPPNRYRSYSDSSQSSTISSSTSTSSSSQLLSKTISKDTKKMTKYSSSEDDNTSTPSSSSSRKDGSDLTMVGTLEELQRTLRWSTKMYGTRHYRTALVYNVIGNMYYRLEQYSEAERYYTRAIKCETGEHLASAYSNLAAVYWRSGRIPDAIQLLHRALRIHEMDLLVQADGNGGDMFDTSLFVASVYHQLGLCHSLSGKLTESIGAMNQSLQIRMRVLGENDIEVARTLDGIGKVYVMFGHYEQGLGYHQQALRIFHDLNVPTTSTAHVLQNIAHVYRVTGNLIGAITILQEVATMQTMEYNEEQEQKQQQQPQQQTNNTKKSLDYTIQLLSELQDEEMAASQKLTIGLNHVNNEGMNTHA